jgi:coenzyme F420-reducing hydrogenase alpha subunit
VEWSNALHSSVIGRGSYLCGPLARFALAADRLSPLAREAAAAASLTAAERNPFRSIVVRAVELLFACDEALRLISGYRPPEPPAADVTPEGDATGYGCTEAPRGLLYHRYSITGDGMITDAKIVPPTSQNQKAIEADLRDFATPRLGMDLHALTHECEQAVRNHDPCISCATHFLDVRLTEKAVRPA